MEEANQNTVKQETKEVKKSQNKFSTGDLVLYSETPNAVYEITRVYIFNDKYLYNIVENIPDLGEERPTFYKVKEETLSLAYKN